MPPTGSWDGGEPVSWELAFLHLVAERARMGLRTLERLEAAAEKARGPAEGLDKCARLPDAVNALLRTPVREVTGRGRFRASAM
jgi:hypothetical protein